MERKIIMDNFWPDEPIYQEDLGWQPYDKEEAKSTNTKVIFDTLVVKLGYNFSFYYIPDGNFYAIHREAYPIEVKRLYLNKPDCDYIGGRCEGDTHDEGDILYTFENPADMWDTIKIDGKSLAEVIENSIITHLSI